MPQVIECILTLEMVKDETVTIHLSTTFTNNVLKRSKRYLRYAPTNRGRLYAWLEDAHLSGWTVYLSTAGVLIIQKNEEVIKIK